MDRSLEGSVSCHSGQSLNTKELKMTYSQCEVQGFHDRLLLLGAVSSP